MQRSNLMVVQDQPYASLSTSSAGAMQPPQAPPRVTGLGLALALAISVTAFLLVVVTGIASYYCTRMREEDDATAAAAAAGGGGGIDEATLMRWPKVVYSEAGACGGLENACCAVCLAEYGEGDVLRRLPECGHLFHVECVDPWLRSHSSCPICRSSPGKPATMKPALPLREVVLSIDS